MQNTLCTYKDTNQWHYQGDQDCSPKLLAQLIFNFSETFGIDFHYRWPLIHEQCSRLFVHTVSKQELSSCWDGRPLGHNNRHWPKIGDCAPFYWGGAGSPFNTMLRGPRPTSVPNGIYPAIWPQQTGAKHWGCAPLGELDPHLTQCLGRGLSACQVSSWLIQRFGHNTSTLQTDRQDRTDNLR